MDTDWVDDTKSLLLMKLTLNVLGEESLFELFIASLTVSLKVRMVLRL